MPLVTDLDLPAFDYMDPALRGERFHERMSDLRARGWLAKGDLGYFVLDREAAEAVLKSRRVTFPGLMVAEVMGVSDG